MAAPPGYNITSEKLTTDYLTALRKHGEQVLRYKLPSSALQSLPIEFIVSLKYPYLKGPEPRLSSSRSLSQLCGLTQLKLKLDSAPSRLAWA